MNRPNILMMSAHDIGRTLGCYGIAEVETPSIDRLAADGIRLTRFHSVAPQCSPSRAAFATGLYPHAVGVIGICSEVFGFDLTRPDLHIANVLGRAGYHTAGVGVAHESLHPERLFDSFDPTHDADGIVSAAGNAIDRLSSGEGPFYIQVGFQQAHRPFVDGDASGPGIYVPPWLDDDPEVRGELAAFQGSIARLDEAVGALLGALERSGCAERTIVCFVADHGIPFPRAKHTLYEPGCEAAALFRLPGRWAGGRTVDAPLSGVDLAPTLLEACGTSSDAEVHGRNFVRLLDGEVEPEERLVFTEQNYHAYLDCSRSVRDCRHKLIANFSPGRGFFDSSQSWRPKATPKGFTNAARTYHPSLELYDLHRDSLEHTNLADAPEHREVLTRLSQSLASWMRHTEDPLMHGIPMPPIYERTMRALGFEPPRN